MTRFLPLISDEESLYLIGPLRTLSYATADPVLCLLISHHIGS